MRTQIASGLLLGATIFGGASGFVGMNASYHLDIASGPTIVLTSATLFAAAYAIHAVRHR